MNKKRFVFWEVVAVVVLAFFLGTSVGSYVALVLVDDRVKAFIQETERDR